MSADSAGSHYIEPPKPVRTTKDKPWLSRMCECVWRNSDDELLTSEALANDTTMQFLEATRKRSARGWGVQ